ncbi:MAG TPA: hypothetical protein VMP01_04550 [Pirellulaceae bacterium]|nr:hypothetical protein [Pirellulaceae bacterium]
MSRRTSSRPLLQFSLQGLMIVMAMIAVVLAVYRQSGWRPLVYYYFMLFLVGPWFAYLFSECLPIQARPVRLFLGNVLLMAMFLGAVQLAEIFFDAAAILLVGVGALVLWSPQYMVFFVWQPRLEEDG